MACFAVQNRRTVIETDRIPAAGIVTVRTLISPVTSRRVVAGDTVCVAAMIEYGIRPHIRVMTVRALPKIVTVRRSSDMARAAVREACMREGSAGPNRGAMTD